MVREKCAGGVDLLKRLVDQAIVRRLNPFIRKPPPLRRRPQGHSMNFIWLFD
jgi:hypothetical protein